MVSLCTAHPVQTLKPQFLSRTICVTVLLILGSASSASADDTIPTPDDPAELQRTWESNTVYLKLPDRNLDVAWPLANARDEIFAKIPADAKLPAVLFLHGCRGILYEGSFLKTLAMHGYVVFEPNSFARKYRPVECRPKNVDDPVVKWSAEATLAEIAYNAQRLLELPWIDHSRIFLMGQSRGGDFAAWYSGNEFRARVVMGTTCWRGISGAPLLAVFSKDDSEVSDWRPERCSKADTYLEIEGTLHWVFQILDVREKIIDWLSQFSQTP